VRLRKGLVAAQVGLSLLLLIGAGLFVQSLKNLRNVNPGFQTDSLVTFFVDPSLNGYKPERSREFYRQLIDRIDSTPGVKTAGLAIMPVLSGSEWDSSVAVEGYSAKQGENVGPHMNFISDGFFDALGIRVLAGRAFDLRDEQPHAAKVGVINETFAKRYFAGQSPVGRHVGMGGDPGTKLDIEIVGVVQDTKYEDMRTEVPYELYRPYRQVEFTIGMNAYVRAQGDPAGLFPALRQAVRETDANVPIVGLRTLQQQVDQSLTTERMLATLSAIFGLLATVLAAVGLYGVMAYMVALRTREIGIRMALGAGRPAVVWLIMREVMLLAGVGIAIGAPAAWFLSRLVESQLFGVKPADPPTILLAMIGIGAVAAISGYLPARRATGIDPIRALRWE
jgi:predicted permease